MKKTSTAPSAIRIVALNDGPYLLYGAPPMLQQFIMVDTLDECWYYQAGRSFSTASDPTRLCRCGASEHKPYCDNTHAKIRWDNELTAPMDKILDDVVVVEGDGVILADNEKYCAYARFCHPKGGTWRLTQESADPASRDLAIRQSQLCPGSRLTHIDTISGMPHELDFAPSIGLLEDPQLGVSAGLWVRGGVAIQREDGAEYELRNRVVLCRCGASHNKPYCDGSHASIKWRDDLEGEPTGETVPETVY
ncbi:MAG: CDGSH iron-sulfur domain-containing protein [Rikenellaceae bacterium]